MKDKISTAYMENCASDGTESYFGHFNTKGYKIDKIIQIREPTFPFAAHAIVRAAGVEEIVWRLARRRPKIRQQMEASA
jgi:hypothetical protein